MADPTPPAATSTLAVHPKVALSVIAGSLVNLILGFLKTKYQIDLAGYETDLTIVVMGIVGYLAPQA